MAFDPFEHLPHLRDRLTPTEGSPVRATDEVLALWDARAREAGIADWRWPDDLREATRRALLDELDPTADLWVFAYGSLMWDPGLHFAEVRIGRLAGHVRRFSYRAPMGRGTPAQPGLVLALERGEGGCTGLVFRIAAADVEAETTLLWRREMIRGGYTPQLHEVTTPRGPVQALVFAANPTHADHAGERPLGETAAVIARAAGHLGSNLAYLEQVAAQLVALGLEDPYIAALLQQARAQAGCRPPAACGPQST